MTDADRIAAFLAKGGAVQSVATAPAYGVDPATDKERRYAAYNAHRDYVMTEQEAEERQQRGVEENGYYKS